MYVDSSNKSAIPNMNAMAAETALRSRLAIRSYFCRKLQQPPAPASLCKVIVAHSQHSTKSHLEYYMLLLDSMFPTVSIVPVSMNV